jgi:hypothetical protein
MADATNHNEAGEQAPSTVEQQAPDVAEERAPATSEPQATDIPSANAPDPKAVSATANPNGAEPKAAKQVADKPPAKAKGAEAEKPAAKAKKEKAPALEDKPLAEFIQEHFLPALKDGLAKQGIVEVELAFEKRSIDINGFKQLPDCAQVIGRWGAEVKQPKAFTIYFFDDEVQGKKGFSYSESAAKPSTLESFLIDERKVNLGLLVFGVLQRLNGQKWLARN